MRLPATHQHAAAVRVNATTRASTSQHPISLDPPESPRPEEGSSMPTYELRLESPVDSQYRRVTVEAPDEQAAHDEANRIEHRLANFTLLPPDQATWENPPGSSPDDPDGVADMRRWDAHAGQWAKWAATLTYPEAVRAADERLRKISDGVNIQDGRLRGRTVDKALATRYVQHLQAEPYAIVDSKIVTQDAIDAGVESMAGAIRMRDIARRFQAAPPAGIDPVTWVKVEEALREGGVPMAAVTAVLFGPAWLVQISGTSGSQVFSSAAVQMSLHSAYTADQDAHDFFNDASGTEIANGNGYTTNGYTFANKAQSYDSSTDQVRLDNTVDPNWTSSTLSATDAVVWVNTAGASSTDPIYGAIDFGATVTTSSGTLTVALDTTGWAVFDLT